MRRFSSTREVAHTAQQMFDLVADVEAYPEFLPLCESLTIERREQEGDHEVIIAHMRVGYKAISETFLSRVLINRDDLLIEVSYLEGPFSHLINRWAFQDKGNGQCDVEFYLEYKFRNPGLQLLMGSVFDAAFGKFTESFQARADEIYK